MTGVSVALVAAVVDCSNVLRAGCGGDTLRSNRGVRGSHKGGDVPDIESMSRPESTAQASTVDQWAPDKGARIEVVGDRLTAYDRGEETSERDLTWFDAVLHEYYVRQLPAPAHVVYGPMAGWRRWDVQLEPRS